MRSSIKKYIFKVITLKISRRLKSFPRLWKLTLVLVVLVSLLFLYVFGTAKKIESTQSPHQCEVTSEQKRHLFNLLKQVSATLEKLDITFFLCYASLWGAIQESGPLPWDPNAELCILSSKLQLHDEASIHREFQRQYLSLEYRSSEGEYVVRNASLNLPSPEVKLIVFEVDSRVGGMLRRVGWKRRLLPPDCDAQPDLQCFPVHLVNPPLPKKSFGPLNINGPREDIDLLKFHYPDTWWKPLKPNC